MKKLKLLLTAAALTATISTASASKLLDSWLTSDWMDRKPLARYKVEAYGFNFRVYEFDLLSDPSKICVVTFSNGNESVPVMQCREKSKMFKKTTPVSK